MSYSQFYDVSGLEQIAINLFYGWGYNFYRIENQLRADNLMIRQRSGFMIAMLKSIIAEAESQYRTNEFPEPTRDKPFPPQKVITTVRSLEALIQAFSALEGRIRVQPVPENDRMTQRYRQERETLVNLAQIDSTLVGQAELLRTMIDDKDYTWLIDNQAVVKAGIAAMNNTLEQRQKMLM